MTNTAYTAALESAIAMEVALHCAGGAVQYAASEDAILAEYNRHGRTYELRNDADGNRVLWHKGHGYSVGVIRPSRRD